MSYRRSTMPALLTVCLLPSWFAARKREPLLACWASVSSHLNRVRWCAAAVPPHGNAVLSAAPMAAARPVLGLVGSTVCAAQERPELGDLPASVWKTMVKNWPSISKHCGTMIAVFSNRSHLPLVSDPLITSPSNHSHK